MSMSAIAQEHPSVKKSEWSLGPTDRCDACGAEALVKVVGISGELLFCGHHYNKIVDDPIGYTKMMSFMLAILDEREKLIEKRGALND